MLKDFSKVQTVSTGAKTVHFAKLSGCHKEVVEKKITFFVFVSSMLETNKEKKNLKWRKAKKTYKNNRRGRCGAPFCTRQTRKPMNFDGGRVSAISLAINVVTCMSAKTVWRERETERQRDQETERQRDQETERQRDREPERPGGRERERERERDTETNRQTDRQTERERERDRETERQRERERERDRERERGRAGTKTPSWTSF